MTATYEQPTAPQHPVAPPPRRRRSRALPYGIGAALATVGTVLALTGGGVLAVAGDDGTIGSGGAHEVSTQTSALVSKTATLEDTRDVATLLGQPRIGVDATGRDGQDVFVGVGRSQDVDRYLRGVTVDRVTDFDVAPFEVEKHREGTGAHRAAPPASQDFWVAQSSGHRAELDWKVRDGDYRLVVMNADGSPRVVTDSQFEVGVPYLSTLGLSVLLAGLLMLGTGGVVLVRTAQEDA
jgi:hypothetical protein